MGDPAFDFSPFKGSAAGSESDLRLGDGESQHRDSELVSTDCFCTCVVCGRTHEDAFDASLVLIALLALIALLVLVALLVLRALLFECTARVDCTSCDECTACVDCLCCVQKYFSIL